MRTTIDLPDSIFRKAKAVASLRGLTLKRFITSAIEQELQNARDSLSPGNVVTFPLVRSKNPGSVRLTSDEIADVLTEEEMDALT